MKVPNIVMPLRLLTKLYTLSFRKGTGENGLPQIANRKCAKAECTYLCRAPNKFIHISYPWHQEVTREMDMDLDSRNRKL
jgi:hypothetical protein